ncbi:uncharacterized protein LOC141899331 [Tubulanus polymorphus]|uniref:uncharacterized protein LOC141899331 n=1 Tax=Tubulanus polymorphus TaxID=672921 RepID=UPI003DA212DA
MHDIDIPKQSVVRCYLGFSKPEDYVGKITRNSLKKWLNKLARKHSNQLAEASLSLIDHYASGNKPLTVIGFPGHANIYQLEEILFKIRSKWSFLAEFMFVHPHSDHNMDLVQRYDVFATPSIVVLDNKGHGEVTLDKRFVEYEVEYSKLDLYFVSRHIPASRLTVATFQSATQMHQNFKPTFILFYAFWANNSLEHLHAYHSTIITLREHGLQAKYGLVDVNEEFDILNRWFDGTYAPMIPFIVVYAPKINYRNNRVMGITRYSKFLSRPSPAAVAKWLKMKNIQLINTKTNTFTIFKPYPSIIGQQSSVNEGPYGSLCSLEYNNATNNEPFVYSKRKQLKEVNVQRKKETKNSLLLLKKSRERIIQMLNHVDGIPVLSESSWQEIIRKSYPSLHPYTSLPWAGQVSSIVLVVFLMADCNSCNSKRDTFVKLNRAVRSLDDGSLFLVNCTEEKLLCEKVGVIGFPTVSAFRGSGWLYNSRCVSERSAKLDNTIRIDYHGVIQVSSIMDWLSKMAEPSVDIIGFNREPKKALKSHLSTGILRATLMPRDSRFLANIPRSLQRKLYPYECFRLVCERLFRQVSCFAKYSQDIPPTEYSSKNARVIVSTVELERTDGLTVTVVKLGQRLIQTLQDETMAEVHKFHQPHTYSISHEQKCEDDHGRCTDLIIDFVSDHIRLLVTVMTSEMFHTKHSIFSASQPVLLALVHEGNVSAEAAFIKELTIVAEKMYKTISVVTVDVYQYPAWAGQFVPKNYDSKIIGNDHVLDLYIYPRLCIIQWEDHNHAAFYHPPSKDTDPFLSNKILDFISSYLKNPSAHIVETEWF